MTDTDVKTGRDLQEKTPSENYPFDFVFTALKDAETINSVIEVIQTSRNTVPSIPVVITNITHNNANNYSTILQTNLLSSLVIFLSIYL